MRANTPHERWWAIRSAQAAVLCTPTLAVLIVESIHASGVAVEWWKFALAVGLGIWLGAATNAAFGVFTGVAVAVAGAVARGWNLDLVVGSAMGIIAATFGTLFGVDRQMLTFGAGCVVVFIVGNQIVFGHGTVYATATVLAFLTIVAFRLAECVLPK
jgi:hypothetical protein